MPDTPTNAPAPAPGAQSSQQMDQLTMRLLSRMMQPHTAVQPSPGMTQPPKMMKPAEGMPQNKGDAQQMFVHNLFSTVFNAVQLQKQQQLKHAVGVLSQLNNSWSKAQDLAQGDQQKAQQIFTSMPEVTHIFEDKKNLKQLSKLLQFDFTDPEKKKTVWHEALGKVVEAGKAFGLTQAIGKLIHANKIDPKMSEAPNYAQRESDAAGAAKKFTGLAGQDPAQQAELSKALPSMISSAGANLREREKEIHQEHIQQMKNEFAEKIQGIKDPVDKAIARGMILSQDGNVVEAQKYFDMAHKGAEAKSTRAPQMSMPALIYRMVNATDPKEREAARKAVETAWGEQEKQLSMRGASFGMGRPMQVVNSETGETDILNGFQVQQRIKAGEKWQIIGNIPPDTVLSMQQIVRGMNVADPGTGKTLRSQLTDDMKAFDNSEDRALISRILRENPAAYGMDESSLGVWMDQNLTGKLSPEGTQLVQDLKQFAEVFNRTRRLTGQTSSEMNTMLLLGLLPNEKTPNSTYGKQQLEKAFNFLDGMVQAPILGGGKFTGKAAAKKPAEATKKGDPLGILE